MKIELKQRQSSTVLVHTAKWKVTHKQTTKEWKQKKAK